MPRPFGAWMPAMSLAELKARTPRPSMFLFKTHFQMRNEVFYQPECLALFKDPQQFKDAVDTSRIMMISDNFFGDGMKPGHNMWLKMGGFSIIMFAFATAIANYFYGTYLPTNNPSWRKVMNKEWEQAINNSPWDHRSHVWAYCDVYAASVGDLVLPGQRHFYLPA